jgi:predicted nucleotidyltransferase
MSFDNDWTQVVSKTTKKSETKTYAIPQDTPLESLMESISKSLAYLKRDIVGCFIYGSRARKTNKPTSDVDLIVFFKQQYNYDDLKEIKSQLVSDIGFSVDFVACVWKKKWIEKTDDRDICYFEQIKPDAIRIIGSHDLSYLIDTSQKLGKVK